jgi:dolichyl-phosphate-mannose-protein mannosyltransferase
MLLFFTFTTVFGLSKFHNQQYQCVVDDLHRGSRDKFERIHSLTTRLRFCHLASGCYVRAANKPLPEWGF